jgi:hypothetical protein
MKQMMPMMSTITRMDVKDVMNLMAIKYKAKKGLSFEDVKQSMELRANQLNFKKVGESPMWKDIQAVLGDMDAPRMEVYHYCDIAAGREDAQVRAGIHRLSALPHRHHGRRGQEHLGADPGLEHLLAGFHLRQDGRPRSELMKYATDIRDKMDVIMRAAAEGDL